LQEFIDDIKSVHLSSFFVTHHNCPKCSLPIGWTVADDIVKYEEGCMCKDIYPKKSSYKSMYEYMMAQRITEDYEAILKRFGLLDLYRKDV